MLLSRLDRVPGCAPVWSVCALLCIAPCASANIGAKWRGAYATEPHGGLAQVAITREKLTIDLRPLADLQPVQVEATYQLDNAGSTQRLDLVFVAGSDEVSEAEVFCGD